MGLFTCLMGRRPMVLAWIPGKERWWQTAIPSCFLVIGSHTIIWLLIVQWNMLWRELRYVIFYCQVDLVLASRRCPLGGTLMSACPFLRKD